MQTYATQLQHKGSKGYLSGLSLVTIVHFKMDAVQYTSERFTFLMGALHCTHKNFPVCSLLFLCSYDCCLGSFTLSYSSSLTFLLCIVSDINDTQNCSDTTLSTA